jgi:hypothetical protein
MRQIYLKHTCMQNIIAREPLEELSFRKGFYTLNDV